VKELTAVIIGFGQSGSRFAQAFSAINSQGKRIRVAGVMDREPAKLVSFPQSTRTSTELEDLWKDGDPDLVIVATNDAEHYSVLTEIKTRGLGFGRIICEKPLVTKFHHGEDIRRQFEASEISVNFLERFSVAVKELRSHLKENRLWVRRVSFTWSKFRVNDPRPSSIGVLSEISHALDLSLFLAEIRPGGQFRFMGGHKTLSDFTLDGESVADELSFSVAFPGEILISGRSSYVTTRRSRRLELFLAREGESRITGIVEVTLDDPEWDDDQIMHYEIGKQGKMKLNWEFRTSSNSVPASRRNINKLCRLIEANMAELSGSVEPDIPRSADALYVQEISNGISEGVGSSHFRGFR